MAKIVDTSLPLPTDDWTLSQVYNGLDCAVTREVLPVVQDLSFPEADLIYDFERAMMAPAIEASLRGIKIDLTQRDEMISEVEGRLAKVRSWLGRLGDLALGEPLKAQSPLQMSRLFYNLMKIKPITSKGRITCDRKALEKINSTYYYARPFVAAILSYRDLNKTLSVLKSGVDSDGRMRFTLNPAGTETGRMSSNKSVFGGGLNSQNITDRLRRIFISDTGMKLAYPDLEQAESRLVGLLCGLHLNDWHYLDVVEQGDVHTYVCKMIWPKLPWTGDRKHDKAVANDTKVYREFSYRYLAKRAGHLSNYMGTAATMASSLHIERSLAAAFQAKYFELFPALPRWHRWVAEQLQTKGFLITPFGRKRFFFGRRNSDETLREAIAFVPQSAGTGDYLNLGLWRIWRRLWPAVEVLTQVHDAVLIQYREEVEAEVIPKVQEYLKVDLNFNGRNFFIPSEVLVGWNWSHFNPKEPLENPWGIKAWPDDRRGGPPQRTAPQFLNFTTY